MTTPPNRTPTKENFSLAEPTLAPQGQPAVHLILGPVGAGKSTYALGLARERNAVRFTLDEWMVRLFSPDRPEDGVRQWYVERAQRCVEQIWVQTTDVLACGVEVVLELGLIQRHQRERFYARAREAGVRLALHLVDAPREVRRQRVLERNLARGATFSMVVPEEIFELASDLWEAPDAAECEPWEVRSP